MRPDLNQLTNLVKTPIKTFAEIGSRDGNDAVTVKKHHNLDPSNVYIFEAHPQCYNNIVSKHPSFNNFNVAITNKTQTVKFQAGIFGKENNVGKSSLLERNPEFNNFIKEEIEVEGWKMEDMLNKLNLKGFDLIKIDAEGVGLEVLQGFGDKIKETKYIQAELEYIEVWEGQSLLGDVKLYLEQKGFSMVNEHKLAETQCDVLFKNNNI